MNRSPHPVPTPRFERVCALATEEATRRGHQYVGVEHLMLAILAEGSSVPAKALTRRATLDEFRSDLEEVMSAYARGGSP